MSPSDWNDERFQLAHTVVDQLSHLTRRLQDELSGESFSKSDSSPVTVADLSSQVVVALNLRKHYPEERLVAEETAEALLAEESMLKTVQEIIEPLVGRRGKDEILACFEEFPEGERAWILDPIDGTKGFLRGDQFAIALALLEHKQLKFGLLGCPRLSPAGAGHGVGVVGAAYRGKGAWQRELSSTVWHRLSVSGRNQADSARLLRSFEASHTNESQIEALVEEVKIVAEPVRMDSQAKYLLLARGDAEAVLRCLAGSNPGYKEKVWDQAAGAIVVGEAGGTISDLNGQPLDFSHGERLFKNTGVLASNGRLQQTLLEGLAVKA